MGQLQSKEQRPDDSSTTTSTICYRGTNKIQSHVSHLLLPEVNSEETVVSRHGRRGQTQSRGGFSHTDLSSGGKIGLEGVGELGHRGVLGEQQTDAFPLFLLAIFCFSSMLKHHL